MRLEEAFPEEGDVDMLKAIHIYKEVGYNGVLVPDNVPLAETNATGRLRSYTFVLGYMKALIQAVESKNNWRYNNGFRKNSSLRLFC